MLDDEPVVRAVIKKLLGRLDVDAAFAVDGPTCVDAYRVALAERKRFDAVIIDLNVPGPLDGRATVAELRALDSGLCAIATSGYTSDPALREPAEHGFSLSLAKPFTGRELTEVLVAIGAIEPPGGEAGLA